MPTVAVQGAQDFSYHQLEQKYKKKIRTAGNKWIFRSINHKEHQKPKKHEKTRKTCSGSSAYHCWNNIGEQDSCIYWSKDDGILITIGGNTMLEKLAATLGKGLFSVCAVVGTSLAEALDKGIDMMFDQLEKEKGGQS